MSLRDKITETIEKTGLVVCGEFNVVKGPKVKMDILECWTVPVLSDGRKMMIGSEYTMTDLLKCGFTLVQNPPNSSIYGDLVTKPSEQFFHLQRQREWDAAQARASAEDDEEFHNALKDDQPPTTS